MHHLACVCNNCAADVSLGRVLLGAFAAAGMAGLIARQSLLLPDRRIPLRLFRGFRRGSGYKPGGARGKLGAGLGRRLVDARRRLQVTELSAPEMVTPESVKQGIEAGLTCEHVEVVGDGQRSEEHTSELQSPC